MITGDKIRDEKLQYDIKVKEKNKLKCLKSMSNN